MRVFLDTNVLVSAFASRGLCAELLELVLLDHDLIVGRNVLRELDKALREKLKLPAARAAEVVDFVSTEAIQVVDNAGPAPANVDAADALVLGEALAGDSESFVTGDLALLRVAYIGTLVIVSPRQFWDILRARDR
ncbi:MAG: PIN domain-containing protein [Burkholderiales bacterium]|nr:PIN domain-containing protein [Burkholderiales bacterium]